MMLPLILTQAATAMGPGLTTSVQGVGGIPPYSYSVLTGGTGGVVDSVTGVYRSPSTVNPNPKLTSDTIQVLDSSVPKQKALCQILVTDFMGLFCDIIETQMQLPPMRVYFWDQKIMQPTDSGLYIAVSNPTNQVFANTNRHVDLGDAGLVSQQNVNVMATFDIDAISRGPEARTRKEQILMALSSDYSQNQQTANSFFIGQFPPGARFLNLSFVDGAAIPYRYKISINVQYAISITSAVPYYDTFEQPQLTVDS